MTRDYKSIYDLNIVREQLTYVDSMSPFLKAMTNLKRLDLSFNYLKRIDPLESLRELRELNLSFNRIEEITNLHKLPNLQILVLNSNRIKRLENLKTLRKLEILSLSGNLLEELAVFNTTEPMIELKEINVARNLITTVKLLNQFPNVSVFTVIVYS